MQAKSVADAEASRCWLQFARWICMSADALITHNRQKVPHLTVLLCNKQSKAKQKRFLDKGAGLYTLQLT